MIDALKLTTQLIEHRNGVKRILADKYQEQVGIARAVLRWQARTKKITLASAALQIAKSMDSAGVDPSLIFAAFVDETEGAG